MVRVAVVQVAADGAGGRVCCAYGLKRELDACAG